MSKPTHVRDAIFSALATLRGDLLITDLVSAQHAFRNALAGDQIGVATKLDSVRAALADYLTRQIIERGGAFNQLEVAELRAVQHSAGVELEDEERKTDPELPRLLRASSEDVPRPPSVPPPPPVTNLANQARYTDAQWEEIRAQEAEGQRAGRVAELLAAEARGEIVGGSKELALQKTMGSAIVVNAPAVDARPVDPGIIPPSNLEEQASAIGQGTSLVARANGQTLLVTGPGMLSGARAPIFGR